MRPRDEIEQVVCSQVGTLVRPWGFDATDGLQFSRRRDGHVDLIQMAFLERAPARLTVGVAVSYPKVEQLYRQAMGVRNAPKVIGCGIHLLQEPYHYHDWDFANSDSDMENCQALGRELTYAEVAFFARCATLQGVRQLYEQASPWIAGSKEYRACMHACILYVQQEPERALAVLEETLQTMQKDRPASRQSIRRMRDYLVSFIQ